MDPHISKKRKPGGPPPVGNLTLCSAEASCLRLAPPAAQGGNETPCLQPLEGAWWESKGEMQTWTAKAVHGGQLVQLFKPVFNILTLIVLW